MCVQSLSVKLKELYPKTLTPLPLEKEGGIKGRGRLSRPSHIVWTPLFSSFTIHLFS